MLQLRLERQLGRVGFAACGIEPILVPCPHLARVEAEARPAQLLARAQHPEGDRRRRSGVVARRLAGRGHRHARQNGDRAQGNPQPVVEGRSRDRSRRVRGEHPDFVGLVPRSAPRGEDAEAVRRRRDTRQAACHAQLLSVSEGDGRKEQRQRAARQHPVGDGRMVVAGRSIRARQQIDVPDPEPNRRSRHPGRFDVVHQDGAQRRGVIQARPPGQDGAEGSEPAPPVDVVAAPEPEPDRSQVLDFRGQLVLITGLRQRRGVDGTGADAGDHVEPQSTLDDEMLACADLPASLRPAARQHQCPAHGAVETGYSAVNSATRLSLKAAMPSRASALWNSCCCSSRSRAWPEASGSSAPDCTARLIRPTARAALCGGQNCCAYSATDSRNRWAGKISLTSPSSLPRSTENVSPFAIISIANALPTTLASRCVPPSPGSTPRLTSGRPIRPAPSLARRTSHASAISSPPPTVWPLSAAIVSLGVCSSRLSVSLAYSENWYRKRGVTRCIIGMFAPAEKNRSPWPLTTSTYTSSSNRACTMAWSSCCTRSYV